MTARRFATRRNRLTVRMVLLGYLILLVCVGAPLLLALKESPRIHWGMLVPLAIVLLMLYVLTGATIKFFASFLIDEAALQILLPPFHRRRIPRSRIRSVTVLDAEQSRQLFDSSIREQFAVQQQMDLVRYIRLLRRKSPAYRYLSVAPSAAVATRGRMRSPVWLKVRSKERMVVVDLVDEKLYLSPDDVDGFVRALQSPS